MRIPELARAARDGDLQGVEAALRDCAVDEALNTGHRPLHLALRGGHVAVVRCLIAAGADTDAATGRGETCLMTAARWCSEVLPELRGAALEPVDALGADALAYGAADDAVVRTLLDWGAMASTVALRSAVAAGAPKSVACLLLAGARDGGETDDPLLGYLLAQPASRAVRSLALPLPKDAMRTTFRAEDGRRLKIGVGSAALIDAESEQTLQMAAFVAGELDDEMTGFLPGDLDAARRTLAHARRHPALVGQWLVRRGVL